MASYKVAQDVEAEDKLLGPFSFRQFIYLVIAVMAGIIAYGLSRVFLPLFIIPVPVIVLFLALALPLRKDQPMEIYLTALVSFYIKPRKRLWQPDGVQSMIQITAPHTEEDQRTKNISGNEAERRLAYLATLADTQGWSVRNVAAPHTNTSMVGDVYNEAQAVPDDFDDNSVVAQSFESMIDRADQSRRQQMMAQMQQQVSRAPQPAVASNQVAPVADDSPVAFNPYPSSMRQHVVSPIAEPSQVATSPPPASQPQPASPPPTAPSVDTSEPQNTSSGIAVSPDIINLANNKDLSVETLAREAHRIEQKSREDEEVVISLR